MAKNENAEKKAKQPAAESGAQGLLRRLGKHFDTKRVASEKKAMKKLDNIEDEDAKTADLEYVATVETKIPETEEMPAVTEASEENENLTEEEYAALYAQYLGESKKASETAEITYDSVYQKILDNEAITAELSAMQEDKTESDFEKNIDEAEKYVDAITAETERAKSMLGTSDDLTGNSHFDVAAYEPVTEDVESLEDDSLEEAPLKEQDGILYNPNMNTDTEMMQAFGFQPDGSGAESGNFREYPFSDTADLQSTEEISIKELEAEEAKTVELPASESDAFEYTSPEQNKSILSIFKSKYRFVKVRMVLSFALAALLLFFENTSFFSELFTDTITYVFVDCLLAVASVALVFDRLVLAAQSLKKFALDVDSVTLLAFVLSFVTTLITLCTVPSYAHPKLYNFPLAVCVFLNTVAMHISLRRDIYSFRVASSHNVKKMLVRMGDISDEVTPEEKDFVGEGAEVCLIKRADFVSDYFACRKEMPASKKSLRILLPLSLVVAVAFFFLAKFAAELNMVESLGVAYASFYMCVPFAAFLSYTYPIYLASNRAFACRSAILGDRNAEKYGNTSVIALRDKDAFPAGKTQVKSIRLYGNRKIESAIYYAAGIFAKVGGPLATVFGQAALNGKICEDVEITELAENGIEALADGKNVVLGKPDYLEKQGYDIFPEDGDEKFEGNTNKRILYLACEGEIVAKVYIQYNTTTAFRDMVRRLAKDGISVSIRTADPCIDDGILAENGLDPEVLPLKVLKNLPLDEKTEAVSAKHGGIVSTGSVKDVIRTMILCNKLENVKKINLFIKGAAILFGVAVMALLLFAGNVVDLPSWCPALYQLFWLIPVMFMSKIYI
ncbi:MAG: hypothetical protein IJW87_02475 [Clostridia bacterium]|nr:hypothetical protein [Clostridia bacterium]